MAVCDICGKETEGALVHACSECGKKHCEECADEDLTMIPLFVCADCEEAWEAEEDLFEEQDL